MTGGTNLKTWIVISVFVLGIGCTAAAGRTIYVDDDGPADFNTIQAAIDDSNDGDTIIVADGTYTGNGNRDIDFGGRAITVRSENGPENCIIDCNGTESEPHRGFYFHNNENANSVLDGFTVTNGVKAFGGAIYCQEEASPTVSNCIFSGNGVKAFGGAIFCIEASPTVSNCIFSGNISESDGGGMYNYFYSNPTVNNCTFSGNLAEDYGGGMANRDHSNPTLTGCMFSGNSADKGGGMYNRNSSPTLTNCTFYSNTARAGGGMYNIESSLTVNNCTFSGNSATWAGGMRNVNSSSTLTNCILWGDSPDEIYIFGEAPFVTYCDVEGGWPGDGNIDADPCFVEPNNGDYHLKSQAGRWNANEGRWTKDEVTSPCIDAGDPKSPIGYELFPNGGIINMGAYGGTVKASKSYFGEPVCETVVAGDINGDCKVNFLDFRIMAFHWLRDENQ